MIWLAIFLIILLAASNGANDNCKGVATLVGYGAATPRQALAWAAITTLLGGVVSFWITSGLIEAFRGGWMFVCDVQLSAAFCVAVLIGAVSWIALATILGLPVSTTHAILGGLCGAGLVSFGGGGVRWMSVAMLFALPLLLSPLLALLIVVLTARPVRWSLRRYAARCVCIAQPVLATIGGRPAAATATLIVADDQDCVGLPGARAASFVTGFHWFTGGMVGVARGWNDTPKIAALAIGALTLAGLPHPSATAFALVGVSMLVGGLVGGRRVLRTLSTKVTPLPLTESLSASFVTASLVSLASWSGMPVSTTHVSMGAIVGAGVTQTPRQVRWETVGHIALAWIVTVPVSASVAGISRWALPA
jgi:PiT family inorganic phosphate transporter